MTPSTHRFFLSAIVGLCSVVIAIIGLSINIKTVPLNEKVQTLTEEKKRLEKENDALKIKLSSLLTLDSLDKIASEKLNMMPPHKNHYILISPKKVARSEP